MKCSKCGANMQEGTLYCPVCGQEVQWVPDYSTLETLMHQQQMDSASVTERILRWKEEQQKSTEQLP